MRRRTFDCASFEVDYNITTFHPPKLRKLVPKSRELCPFFRVRFLIGVEYANATNLVCRLRYDRTDPNYRHASNRTE